MRHPLLSIPVPPKADCHPSLECHMYECTRLVEGEIPMIRRSFVCCEDPFSEMALRRASEIRVLGVELGNVQSLPVHRVLHIVRSTISKFSQQTLALGGFS